MDDHIRKICAGVSFHPKVVQEPSDLHTALSLVAAGLGLALYVVFFLPGIAALLYAGYDYAALSWRIGEHSMTAGGPVVYPFKTVIPVAGAFLLVQGIVEVILTAGVAKVAEPTPEG